MNVTYFKMINEENRKKYLSEDFMSGLKNIDYTSPVMKINIAVSRLPKFKSLYNLTNGDYESDNYNVKIANEYLSGTIHLNCENMDIQDLAYREALNGKPSSNPIIEMTIPSILDKTLVPPGSGHHVIGLFVQYAPTKLNAGIWDEKRKKDYARTIYQTIDEYCPGFSKSIIFDDILSPLDLENEFSLTGGNIFHGSMDLNSIFFCRPFKGHADYKQTINGLWSCSSAMHPGGGIMGAPGRNCAKVLLSNF